MYAAAAGVLSHWTYFIRGEHHLEAPRLVVLAMALPVVIFVFLFQYADFGVIQAAVQTTLVAATYLTSIWTSIIVYRIFFHPLRRFPGPFMAKVSKFWHVLKLAPKLDNYRQLDEMHRRYGDFVRTGTSLQ